MEGAITLCDWQHTLALLNGVKRARVRIKEFSAKKNLEENDGTLSKTIMQRANLRDLGGMGGGVDMGEMA